MNHVSGLASCLHYSLGSLVNKPLHPGVSWIHPSSHSWPALNSPATCIVARISQSGANKDELNIRTASNPQCRWPPLLKAARTLPRVDIIWAKINLQNLSHQLCQKRKFSGMAQREAAAVNAGMRWRKDENVGIKWKGRGKKITGQNLKVKIKSISRFFFSEDYIITGVITSHFKKIH